MLLSKKIFLDSLKQYHIDIADINDYNDQSLSVLIGFYSYELIDLCKTNQIEKIKNHISFLDHIIKQNEIELNNFICIDLFTNIHTELGEPNLVKNMLSGLALCLYEKAVKEWEEENR